MSCCPADPSDLQTAPVNIKNMINNFHDLIILSNLQFEKPFALHMNDIKNINFSLHAFSNVNICHKAWTGLQSESSM